MKKLKILYIGESWLGSCARSLKEAFSRHHDIVLDEVNIDLYLPANRSKILRLLHRVFKTYYIQDLYREILTRISAFNPDVVVVYKGSPIEAGFIKKLKSLNFFVVNVYPDCSPHAHGKVHKEAVGVYDLVISTKVFHPDLWKETYGYNNKCVFVPQGYDPLLHLMPSLPDDFQFDVTLVATWRPEYGELMKEVGKLLAGKDVKVGIGGNGWEEHRDDYPSHWTYAGALHGQSYVNWLRRGKVCIAPITRNVYIDGEKQPGDVDTTRTYELAAAHCFFIHKRTEFINSIYDEKTEVPTYDSPEELAQKIFYYLNNEEQRKQMAVAAHKRAVANYSLDSRVDDILKYIKKYIEMR